MNDLDFEDIVAYFTNFDSKNSGALDFNEFKELIKTIGFNLDEERLKEGFDKIDTDNNNEISLDEFMIWWGENKQ